MVTAIAKPPINSPLLDPNARRPNRHRVNLFSLSANAGAALAAAVVQPGAAGLNAVSFFEGPNFSEGPRAEGAWCGDSQGGAFKEGWGARERSGGDDDGCDCGVVFESLDSRIMEDALVSTMGRLGLAVKCRSRWGQASRSGDVIVACGDNS